MDSGNTRTLVIVAVIAAVLLAVLAWWWSGRGSSAPSGQQLQQIQAERAMKREK
jgi:beta-lactam-binding protein with PASTA domain